MFFSLFLSSTTSTRQLSQTPFLSTTRGLLAATGVSSSMPHSFAPDSFFFIRATAYDGRLQRNERLGRMQEDVGGVSPALEGERRAICARHARQKEGKRKRGVTSLMHRHASHLSAAFYRSFFLIPPPPPLTRTAAHRENSARSAPRSP